MATTAEITEGDRFVPASLWWVVLLQGIAAIVIGLLLFTDPQPTLVTLTLFLGVYWFIGGIFDLVRTFTDSADWGWHLIAGLLGVLAGLAIVRNPLWAAMLVPATLVWVLGILGVVIGVLTFVQAFRGGGWGPGSMGALSIIFGLLLIFGNVFITASFLVFLIAGVAVVGGIVAVIMSFQIKNATIP